MYGNTMLTKDQWKALVTEYESRCAYCGHAYNALCQEHVIPVCRGGSDDIENIVPACRRCNVAKGEMTGVEFGTYLEDTGLGALFRLRKGPDRSTRIRLRSVIEPAQQVHIAHTMSEGRRMVSTAEAAEMLGVARGHVRYLARTGRLEEYRISERAVAYDAGQVERLVAEKAGRRRLPKRPKEGR